MNSLLLGLAHLRKSVSGHVPVLFICCEYHFFDTINIWNNEFLILDKFKFQPTSSSALDISAGPLGFMPGPAPGELSDQF